MKPQLTPVAFATALSTSLLLSIGCTTDIHSECRSSADCSGSDFCQMGRCSDPHHNHPEGKSLLGKDEDSPSSNHGDVGYHGDTDVGENYSEPPHPCPDAPPAASDNLVLNEFMANVPAGPEGDANQDGVRHFHDDEFVELVNVSDETIDLTDVDIQKETDTRFSFPPTCLDSLHAVVVFGGIEDGADPPSGDGFTSMVSEQWFTYAQSSGHVVIRGADDELIAEYVYGSHPDGSLNLDPDLTGTDYVAHRDINDDGALFSPGTCANGLPFPTGCTKDDDENDDNGGSDYSDSKPSPGD